MTRKHYIAIAASIKTVKAETADVLGSSYIARRIAEEIAVEMKRDNARFDRARFMEACGF